MQDDINLCPVCEEGALSAATFADDFKHNGQTVHVTDLECYRCPACGADPVFEDQIRRNQLKIADAKRALEGLLTGAQIRAAREKLGLTQSEAAQIFGGGVHAFSKYERGDGLQSRAMDQLIRLVVKHPSLLGDLGDPQSLWTDEEAPLLPQVFLESEPMPGSQSLWTNEEGTLLPQEFAEAEPTPVDAEGIRNGELIEDGGWHGDKAA